MKGPTIRLGGSIIGWANPIIGCKGSTMREFENFNHQLNMYDWQGCKDPTCKKIVKGPIIRSKGPTTRLKGRSIGMVES